LAAEFIGFSEDLDDERPGRAARVVCRGYGVLGIAVALRWWGGSCGSSGGAACGFLLVEDLDAACDRVADQGGELLVTFGGAAAE
jgi:hypothetical protein